MHEMRGKKMMMVQMVVGEGEAIGGEEGDLSFGLFHGGFRVRVSLGRIWKR